jgi:hypothetical protein
MRVWICVGVLAGFAASAMPGCGDEEEPSGPGADYAAAICDAMASCDCRDPSYTDRDECFDELYGEYVSGERRAEARGWTFDPDCLEASLAYIEDVGCMNVPEIIEAHLWTDFCQLFYGDAEPGEPCEPAFGLRMSGCEQGIICSPGAEYLCYDFDDPPPELGEGEACLDDEGFIIGDCDYDAGLVCHWEAGTCVVPSAEGEHCRNDYPCDYDTWCDEETDPSNPVCVPRKPLGEPCESMIECESLECFDVCVEREPEACEGDVYF